jgi:hypothetical protein
VGLSGVVGFLANPYFVFFSLSLFLLWSTSTLSGHFKEFTQFTWSVAARITNLTMVNIKETTSETEDPQVYFEAGYR